MHALYWLRKGVHACLRVQRAARASGSGTWRGVHALFPLWKGVYAGRGVSSARHACSWLRKGSHADFLLWNSRRACTPASADRMQRL